MELPVLTSFLIFDLLHVRRFDLIRKEIEEFSDLFSPKWVLGDCINFLDELVSCQPDLISPGGAIHVGRCNNISCLPGSGVDKKRNICRVGRKDLRVLKVSSSGIRKNSRDITWAWLEIVMIVKRNDSVKFSSYERFL